MFIMPPFYPRLIFYNSSGLAYRQANELTDDLCYNAGYTTLDNKENA